MLSERTPARWLFLAAVTLATAALMPWAYIQTDEGVEAVSGMPYGGAETLLLGAVAAGLILFNRAQAAAYISLTAAAFSGLVVYNLPGTLEYSLWDSEVTGGPIFAVAGSLMLFTAAVTLRRASD